MNRIFSFFLGLCAMIGAVRAVRAADVPEKGTRVLCTTFPIYQITRNLVQGRDTVSVELMLPAQLGCPHDYALTPQDMRKLAKADVLVVNGLGMEEFLGAPVERANAGLTVIDSSVGIKDTLNYTDGQKHAHEWAGAFDLKPGTYRWSFAKVDGQYADPAMKIVAVRADGSDAIEKAEAQAAKLFTAEGRRLTHGDEIGTDELCVLNFEEARERTVFEFKPRASGRYVFFTEHLPFEFEAGEHFLKDAASNDVEPVAQEPEAEHGHDHGHHHSHDHDHGHGAHHHHHSGVNPHLFASPRQAARLSLNVAAGLSKVDPDGATVYFRNAQAYAKRLNALADEFSALGRRLANNRVVQPHGVMDYLARDMGLEIVAVTQAHGQEPSAAEMRKLVETIRETKAGAILTEPQYSDKVGRTLAKEAGVPTAVFDPVASGPENSPLDYYEKTMRTNLRTLETILRTR